MVVSPEDGVASADMRNKADNSTLTNRKLSAGSEGDSLLTKDPDREAEIVNTPTR